MGCLEAEAILDGDRVSLESLREMMPGVRSWAKARLNSFLTANVHK
ncbi:MAG TPA: hypothetical protein VK211_28575 [Kamptonema sp.]|nr:hypothetical protein [Kamptonema sp.]